jgi:broad specificity phosphatase PhoE
MTTLYLMRHTESAANVRNILAGQQDFALSTDGKADAAKLAEEFSAGRQIDAIWCSPLLRAQQTAAPFVVACNAPLSLDKRLMEQNLGRFSGLSYAEAEADPAYCRDRLARWHWVPEGGGESYEMIATRVDAFLDELRKQYASRPDATLLIVTHAVTLRLFRACIERTLPDYPEKIAANGEIWRATLSTDGSPAQIETLSFAFALRTHRA